VSQVSSAKSPSDNLYWLPSPFPSPLNSPEAIFTPFGADSSDFSANWSDRSFDDSFSPLSSFGDPNSFSFAF
jgi:hypothetical protein